jgi:FkbM family methyltransferase
VSSENPFISHSQNFEDVILWRLLAHVDSGFYIDLGAQHPIYDSVTHAFYERGWSGINVEPNQDFLDLLNLHRPRDTNLGWLIGSSVGTAKFFRTMDGSGLSTGVLEFAKNLESQSTPMEIESKEVKPLSEICETYVKGDIHFLKIDVEGMEREVILGANFQMFRPWIVVVEAFQPNSRIESHGEWEDLLINSDYEMVYADGLNRFYLAKEKSELKKGFEFPPNVFDNFKMLAVVDHDVRVGVLEQAVVDRDVRVGVLEQAVVDRDVRVGVLEQAVVDRDRTIYSMHTAISWRITWPIRVFFSIASRHCRNLVNFPKKTIDRIIAIAVLPLIRELQMRPELLKKISNFAKRIKVYNFLLNRYLKGEEEWVAIQPDKSFVMLGQRFDPEKWLRDAKNVRRTLNKKTKEISETAVKRSKHEFGNDVGVIVSLYKCEAFLPYFLESLKRQTIFSESQIYVGAVQPSDFELELLNQFSSECSNVILEIFDYRAGIYEVWNHGVKQTTSQFLTNMNVDDLRRDDSLEMQAQFLKNHESIDVAYQDVYLSFGANAEWDLIEGVGLSTSLPHVSLPMMNLGFNPPHNAPMWRRRVHDEVGLFDETFKSAGDFDLWVRAFINGSKFLKMGEIHASYYFNPEGISTTAGGASLDETSRILAICHQEIENQKLNTDGSPETPNIKKYGLADGMTLDLIEEIGLLLRTSKP